MDASHLQVGMHRGRRMTATCYNGPGLMSLISSDQTQQDALTINLYSITDVLTALCLVLAM